MTRIQWSAIAKAARETSEALNGKNWVNASIKARVLLADLADEVERLAAERDKLIDACIAETWRQPLRTLASAEDSGIIEHGWEWRVRATGDFERTRADAVAAVRKAAGLEE